MSAEPQLLAEKDKIPQRALEDLVNLLKDSDSNLEMLPLDLGVIESLSKIPREDVPDMPDRIIAASSLSRGVPLVTRDRRIRTSSVNTIW